MSQSHRRQENQDLRAAVLWAREAGLGLASGRQPHIPGEALPALERMGQKPGNPVSPPSSVSGDRRASLLRYGTSLSSTLIWSGSASQCATPSLDGLGRAGPLGPVSLLTHEGR